MKSIKSLTLIFMMSHFIFLMSLIAGSDANQVPINLLANGNFEEGVYCPTELPSGWISDAWQPSAIFIWDDTESSSGEKSVKIDAPDPNDARWLQTVEVDPNTLYFLSGWIKTKDVGHSLESVDAGANLCLFGTWTHSEGIFDTQGWTRKGFLFNSKDDLNVTVAARLGFWSGTTTGTAWFDDIQLEPIVPMIPHPSWKFLVLIYQETDFAVTDEDGTAHRYVASMTQDEIEEAALASTLFVEDDIPALTSGNMIPEVTVRFPERALTELSPVGGGWWPSPADTAPERDPQFDSVIVIWDPRATDLLTGAYQWIGYGDGLALNMGTGQTYNTMQVDAAVYRNHRNVFKHEWGHAILYFFDAVDTAPKPTVSNHAGPTDYVNCLTGEYYVWVDETLDYPIPNSIYNNDSGFTHDYYSGTTATADQPTRCLGIPPEAWTLGGPVTHSGNGAPAAMVAIDIKPGSCPNPFKLGKSKGVLPAAILGSEEFDVSTVLVDTVRLNGNCPVVKYSYEDVATPYEDGFSDPLDENDCHTLRADGYFDLSVKFARECATTTQAKPVGKEARIWTISGKYVNENGGEVEFTGRDVVRVQ